jgi:hypothetical protein
VDDGPTAPQDPSARVLPPPVRPSTPTAGPGFPRRAPPSIEISMSSVPGLRAEPARRPASDADASGDGVSGEIIVPAAAVRDAERSLEAAPAAWPDRRYRWMFYLCVLAIAGIAAAALAAA